MAARKKAAGKTIPAGHKKGFKGRNTHPSDGGVHVQEQQQEAILNPDTDADDDDGRSED